MVAASLISRARPEERPAALQLAFAHLGEVECSQRVAHILDMISLGEIDPDGLLLLKDDHAIRGVFACLPMPGGTALVWPPRGDWDDRLVAAGLNWLRERGVKLAQAIVPPQDADELAPLLDFGFVAAGPMNFFRRDLHDDPASPGDSAVHPGTSQRPVPQADAAPAFTLIAYPSADAALFAQTLERTYDGTLDFPELSNVRTIAEILTTYRSSPLFRPEHWRLAMVDDRPAGVLLLTEVNPLEDWELTYVGVVPELRRRGLGRALVESALHLAANGGGSRLEVAVDARNSPALQLYSRLEFQLVGERRLALCFLTQSR